MSSVQQAKYLAARADGRTMHTACVESGVPMAEARLIEAAIGRGELELPSLISAASGEDANLKPIPAAGEAASPEESDMARGRKKGGGQTSVEEHKPDFALAVKYYRGDIKPAQASIGTEAQSMSTAYKEIKKIAHVNPQAARLAFRLDQMEEHARDDYLRSLRGLLTELRIFMPKDMVDNAEGNEAAGGEVIPTGERTRPTLATVNDDDLNHGEHETSAVDEAQAAAQAAE